MNVEDQRRSSHNSIPDMSMSELGPPEILITLVVVVLLLGRNRWFGGGGRGRFHPIPANDSWFLTRKRGQKKQA